MRGHGFGSVSSFVHTKCYPTVFWLGNHIQRGGDAVARLNHRHCIVHIFFNNLTIFFTLPQRSCHDSFPKGLAGDAPTSTPDPTPPRPAVIQDSQSSSSVSLFIDPMRIHHFFTKKSSNFENWRTNYQTGFELEVQLIADVYLLRQRYTQVAFDGGHHFLLSFCYSINQYLFCPKNAISLKNASLP